MRADRPVKTRKRPYTEELTRAMHARFAVFLGFAMSMSTCLRPLRSKETHSLVDHLQNR